MNSKRSYLDAVNAGRQRRSYASLEQLNRSLDTLEQRIERNREEGRRPRRPAPRGTALRPGRREPAHAGPPPPVRVPQRLRTALPVDRPRHRARAQGGGRRRRLRQDRRRTEGPARGAAPPDGGEPARRVRHAAQGFPAELRVGRQGGEQARHGRRAPLGRDPVARRPHRRQKRQHAAAGDRADEIGARHACARRDGAFGRPPLGRLRPAFRRFRAPHLGGRRAEGERAPNLRR